MLQLTTFSTENPLINIEILGEKNPFLVDTDAAVSVLKKSALKVIPSKRTMQTVSASGIPSFEPLTYPFPVAWKTGKLRRRFLYSSSCPVNLLGGPHVQNEYSHLLCEFSHQQVEFLHVWQSNYNWLLEDAFIEGELRGMSFTSPHQEDWEVPKHLHWTAAVPSIEEDQGFEIRYTKLPEKIELRIYGIYYGESLTAAAVLLTDAHSELYEVQGNGKWSPSTAIFFSPYWAAAGARRKKLPVPTE